MADHGNIVNEENGTLRDTSPPDALPRRSSTASSTEQEERPLRYKLDGFWQYEVEDVEHYRPGGYHPVHLGDMIDDRFEVVHKLGFGGIGTVWLCRDQSRGAWRAVKILSASFSSDSGPDLSIMGMFRRKGTTSRDAAKHHILLPEEHFWIDGPNGRHLCLVLPVLGPSLTSWLEYNMGEPRTLKDLCQQMTEGLRFLHDRGVCHGDFRTDNILMKPRNLDTLRNDEMIEILGDPEVCEVETRNGEDHKPAAPDYLVVPGFWSSQTADLISTDIFITDFGESFEASQPPKDLGIPRDFAAPEVTFEMRPGLPSDIWSLGCAFMVLFDSLPFAGTPFEAAKRLEVNLGPLPAEYIPGFMRLYSLQQQAEHKNNPEAFPSRPRLPSISRLDDTTAPQPVTGSSEELEEERAEELKGSESPDIIANLLGRPREIPYVTGPNTASTIKYTMPRDEVLQLTNLVRGIFLYEPAKRLTPREILDHVWFKNAPRNSTLTARFTRSCRDIAALFINWVKWIISTCYGK